MIMKKKIPYHQDFLTKAFSDTFPKENREKIITHLESFIKTNQNNQKGIIKR